MNMDPIMTAPTALDSMQWKASMQNGRLNEKQQIDEAAKQFESILLRQFLDEALKTADGEGGLLGSSVPMYDHIIKDTLANSITKGTSLGLSSMLQAQLHSGAQGETQKIDK